MRANPINPNPTSTVAIGGRCTSRHASPAPMAIVASGFAAALALSSARPLRAVLGGVLGLVHHLVLGLAHVGPEVVLEPCQVRRRAQPARSSANLARACSTSRSSALSSAALIGCPASARCPVVPCPGSDCGAQVLSASKLWPRLLAGLCGAVVPRL